MDHYLTMPPVYRHQSCKIYNSKLCVSCSLVECSLVKFVVALQCLEHLWLSEKWLMLMWLVLLSTIAFDDQLCIIFILFYYNREYIMLLFRETLSHPMCWCCFIFYSVFNFMRHQCYCISLECENLVTFLELLF